MKLCVLNQTSIAKVTLLRNNEVKPIHLVKKNNKFVIHVKAEGGLNFKKHSLSVQLVFDEPEHRLVDLDEKNTTPLEYNCHTISEVEASIEARVRVLSSKREGFYFQLMITCFPSKSVSVSTFSQPLQIVSKLKQAKRILERVEKSLKVSVISESSMNVAQTSLSNSNTQKNRFTSASPEKENQYANRKNEDDGQEVADQKYIVYKLAQMVEEQSKQLQLLNMFLESGTKSSLPQRTCEATISGPNISSNKQFFHSLFQDSPLFFSDKISSLQDDGLKNLTEEEEDMNLYSSSSLNSSIFNSNTTEREERKGEAFEESLSHFLHVYQSIPKDERVRKFSDILLQTQFEDYCAWTDFLEICKEERPQKRTKSNS